MEHYSEVFMKITYGYAKQYRYTGDGTLQIQVRIQSIHGPFSLTDGRGKLIINYVADEHLPFYSSILLPHLPNPGDVVALLDDSLVIGLTGGSYVTGTNL